MYILYRQFSVFWWLKSPILYHDTMYYDTTFLYYDTIFGLYFEMKRLIEIGLLYLHVYLNVNVMRMIHFLCNKCQSKT